MGAFSLPAEMAPVKDAEALCQSLWMAYRQSRDDGSVLEISAQEVQTLTSFGIQMLVSLHRQASDDGLKWSLRAPSEDFIAAMEDFGLFSLLMTWPVSF